MEQYSIEQRAQIVELYFQINDPLFWLSVHIVVILMCGLDPQSQQ